jgi:PhnB protein
MEGAFSFAPELFLQNVAAGIQFYQNALGATELRRWSNDDGSVHVAELQIGDALFHLHEETPRVRELSPQTLNGTPVVIGLFVTDTHAVYARALTAGATELHPVQDYDYGYRQGSFSDPFGHHWTVQQKIG